MRTLALILAISMATCHRDPPTAVASSSDEALCAHLAHVGCRAGADESCAVSLARLRTLEPIPDTCLLAAPDGPAVRGCGWECP